MPIIKNLSLTLGTHTIFNNLSCSLDYADKIGVLGRNGAGKSTLLRVIAKLQPVDSGTVTYTPSQTIAYLPQDQVINSKRTVIQEALGAHDALFDKQKQINQIEQELAGDCSPEKAHLLVERYELLQNELTHFNEQELTNQAIMVLKGLGFSDKKIKQPVHELSVGWQMRVCLARLLLQNADFYLFDEPTNHLDLPAKEWLLSYLQAGNFGYLLVTHDRYYLEKASSKILEIEQGKAQLFNGNFSFYLHEKEEQKKRIQDAYSAQQKEIARKKETINRFRASANKAKMVQSMIRDLDKMEKIELPQQMPSVSFNFPAVERAGRCVLSMKNISKSFNHHLLFKNINGEINRSQKVALIAANGVGKTTLFNIIVGHTPATTGTVTFGHNVSYAYFQQEQSRILKPTNSILEEVMEHTSGVGEEKIRTFLGSFLFSDNTIHKKIKVLSGGEKNRVAMVKVLLQNANFLILDEPTNHLDIYAKEVLLQALKQYQGTVFLVSHDHDFIQNYANVIMELTPTHLTSYEGNYEGYLYYRNEFANAQEKTKPVESAIKEQAPKHNKATHKEIRRLERTIHNLEQRIEKITEALATVTFGTPDYDKKVAELKEHQIELAAVMKEWEEWMN